MEHKAWFNLLAAVGLTLALSGGILAAAQGPGPQGALNPKGEVLGTAFTYQGRLTDSATGDPIPGPCDLRFTLYQSAAGDDPVGTPRIKTGVALNDGYFTVELDFGAAAFAGDGRYLRIEVNCGSGYTALSPRAKLSPAPYALHAVSTGALRGRQVSDNAPSAGDVLAWDGSSWMPTSGAGNAWSLTGNGGTTPGTNFLGTTDNQALQLHVNGARALRLEPHAISPNLIGGYSGNSVDVGVYGATIGGGGRSGNTNRVTAGYGTVGGGASNIASGNYATVPGGYAARAFLDGQMAYASGPFANPGDAQSSLYVMRKTTMSLNTWENLYLDGNSTLLAISPTRTLMFDILVVGRSSAGESAGYYIWGMAENVGGTVTLLGGWVSVAGEDDPNWDVRVQADSTNGALLVQVKGNGQTIRWVATVRTAEVAW